MADAVAVQRMGLGDLLHALDRFVSQNDDNHNLRIRCAAKFAADLRAKIGPLESGNGELPVELQSEVDGLLLAEIREKRHHHSREIDRLDEEERRLKLRTYTPGPPRPSSPPAHRPIG